MSEKNGMLYPTTGIATCLRGRARRHKKKVLSETAPKTCMPVTYTGGTLTAGPEAVGRDGKGAVAHYKVAIS
jgi:hypothetical protein